VSGARLARNPAAPKLPATVVPTAAPIGREIDRRVDALVAAVLGCPLVASLHPGRDGRAVSNLPGRRVIGVRVTVDRVGLHVVARYPAVLDDVARQIRAAVAPLTAGSRIDVTIEDLAVSGGPPPPGRHPREVGES
jgi:hypothetical protein